MNAGTKQSMVDHELFRANIFARSNAGIGVTILFSTILGVVISLDTGKIPLLIFFLLTMVVGGVISSRKATPYWMIQIMPSSHAVFIALATYYAQQPLLAGLYLIEYSLLNAMTSTRLAAALWASVGVAAFTAAYWLNPALEKNVGDIYFLIGFVMAVGIVLSMSFVFNTVIASFEKEYWQGRLKVEESGARYDVLLNSIGDGMVITDKNGFIQFVNRRALDLISAEREQLLGQPISAAILMQSQDGTPLRHTDYPVTDVLARGERLVSNLTSKKTYQIVRSDNATFPVSLSISPVQVMGTIDGAVVLFDDSSEFEEMEKAKSEFVSLASHQLRTPLNVVSWYAEKLKSQRKGKLNERQLDYVSEIYANNKRMISLVSDLLNVSRVDLGRRKRKHQAVDLKQLITDLLKEVQPLSKEKKITVNTSIGAEELSFKDSDQSMVTVIIQNLISNAIKYTPQGGTVTLQVNSVKEDEEIDPVRRVHADKAGYLLVVADSGVGIPAHQRDQVFSRLFRADNVQSMDVEGTGLGLYVTHSFARMLDGDIWFESTEGKGTTFFVYLPK